MSSISAALREGGEILIAPAHQVIARRTRPRELGGMRR